MYCVIQFEKAWRSIFIYGEKWGYDIWCIVFFALDHLIKLVMHQHLQPNIQLKWQKNSAIIFLGKPKTDGVFWLSHAHKHVTKTVTKMMLE